METENRMSKIPLKNSQIFPTSDFRTNFFSPTGAHFLPYQALPKPKFVWPTDFFLSGQEKIFEKSFCSILKFNIKNQ
jgi:hypothetical protein